MRLHYGTLKQSWPDQERVALHPQCSIPGVWNRRYAQGGATVTLECPTRQLPLGPWWAVAACPGTCLPPHTRTLLFSIGANFDASHSAAAMAESIGLAASIVAIVELSAKIGKLCVKYYSGVKNAADDIARLQDEIAQSTAILKEAQQLLDGQDGAKLIASRNLCDGLEDSLEQFKTLESRLAPDKKSRVMRYVGALKWPFDSAEINAILKNLERSRNMIFFGLQVDQTYVISFPPGSKG